MSEHVVPPRVPPSFAMVEVFDLMSARWPNFFSPDRAPDLLPMWLDACGHVNQEAWAPAAREFRATAPAMPPSPPEFAKVAQRLAGELFGAAAVVTPHRRSVLSGARPFRFASPGREMGWGRWDAENALAFLLADGQSFSGVTEDLVSQMMDKTIEIVWINPPDQPAWLRDMVR